MYGSMTRMCHEPTIIINLILFTHSPQKREGGVGMASGQRRRLRAECGQLQFLKG